MPVDRSDAPLLQSEASHRLYFCNSGRPRVLDAAARREAILDAASQALQDYGFQGASMDRIAKIASMSKKTLYTCFESKPALFEALITDRLLTFRTVLDETPAPLAEQLAHHLKSFCREFMDPERISLLRTVTGETRAPEIRKIVSDLFSMKCDSFPLRLWLRQQCENGRLGCRDIDRKTDLIFSMTIGARTLSELTGCRAGMSEAETDLMIDYAVNVFLRGIEEAP